MRNFFPKGSDWEGDSYTGIIIPSILCNSINQAASYWSSVPHHLSCQGLGAIAPAGYATVINGTTRPGSVWRAGVELGSTDADVAIEPVSVSR